MRFVVVLVAWMVLLCLVPGEARGGDRQSLLDNGMLITWYGNPHTGAMGVLGQASGQERASALRRQMAEYEEVTTREVHGAYHLVAAVAQPHAGADGYWRRQEYSTVIQSLLDEAREHGFKLILDIQPGRAPVPGEVERLRPFLEDPLVHLAIDPEFVMEPDQVPGQQIGSLRAADVNAALAILEDIIEKHDLPTKTLILYQFTLGMLPDKENIRESPTVDVVLVMDGIGSRPLKMNSYDAVMRQGQLPFAGIKVFYEADVNPFAPADILKIEPLPVVISYQ